MQSNILGGKKRGKKRKLCSTSLDLYISKFYLKKKPTTESDKKKCDKGNGVSMILARHRRISMLSAFNMSVQFSLLHSPGIAVNSH